MRNFTLLIISIMFPAMMLAQVPSSFNYQAVARDSGGDLIINQKVGFQISILQGSVSGTPVYTETHTDTTNAYGLVSLKIGEGATGDDFSTIDWSNAPYFLKIEMDENGGSDYQFMGTNQLLSVPFAMYAEEAGNTFSGDYNDLGNLPDFSNFDQDASDDFDGQYSSLTGNPDFSNFDQDVTDDFSGSFSDLIGKPNIIDSIESVLDTTTQFIRTEQDGDSSNEIQELSYANDSLGLSGANKIELFENKRVAFRATLTSNQSVMPSAYDTLKVNITSGDYNFEYPGGIFDNDNYMFIVPEDGYYFFESTTLWAQVNDGVRTGLCIMINDDDVMWGFDIVAASADYITNKVSSVFYVNEGDKVWIRVWQEDSLSRWIQGQSKYVSFSGFQIF